MESTSSPTVMMGVSQTSDPGSTPGKYIRFFFPIKKIKQKYLR